MAIPANTQRAVIFGTLPGGEIWETGFWLFGGLPTSSAAANEQAQIIFNVLLSEADPPFLPAVRDLCLTNQGSIRGLRVYVYPAGGPHAAYVGEYQPASPIAGTSTSNCIDQAAIVCTLNTGLAGRRNRGRMYLPGCGLAIQTNGQILAATAGYLADNLAAAFSDLAGSDAGTPVVVSGVGSTHEPISSVKVDTKVDIQRRRANKVVPAAIHVAAVS